MTLFQRRKQRAEAKAPRKIRLPKTSFFIRTRGSHSKSGVKRRGIRERRE